MNTYPCAELGVAMCVGSMVMRPQMSPPFSIDDLCFFNSKSGNCLARLLSAVSVAKNHPKVFRYADSN